KATIIFNCIQMSTELVLCTHLNERKYKHMAHKSESTSSQTGVETANEVQLEELNPQMASDVSILESKAEAEQPGEADIETFIHIAQQLESELCSIVVGQERVIRELLLALFA